jgi:hypothetical protein
MLLTLGCEGRTVVALAVSERKPQMVASVLLPSKEAD